MRAREPAPSTATASTWSSWPSRRASSQADCRAWRGRRAHRSSQTASVASDRPCPGTERACRARDTAVDRSPAASERRASSSRASTEDARASSSEAEAGRHRAAGGRCSAVGREGAHHRPVRGPAGPVRGHGESVDGAVQPRERREPLPVGLERADRPVGGPRDDAPPVRGQGDGQHRLAVRAVHADGLLGDGGPSRAPWRPLPRRRDGPAPRRAPRPGRAPGGPAACRGSARPPAPRGARCRRGSRTRGASFRPQRR